MGFNPLLSQGFCLLDYAVITRAFLLTYFSLSLVLSFLKDVCHQALSSSALLLGPDASELHSPFPYRSSPSAHTESLTAAAFVRHSAGGVFCFCVQDREILSTMTGNVGEPVPWVGLIFICLFFPRAALSLHISPLFPKRMQFCVCWT